MAKRSYNNSTGRRAHGEKPYDANNSFVKKMATKMTEMIPQRSWISKWFNSPSGNGELSSNEDNENPDGKEMEETLLQPLAKRPRIRMDVTHPPGTFTIQPKARNKDQYHGETVDFLDAEAAGPSAGRSLVSSTPAISLEMRNSIRSDLRQPQNNVTANGVDENSESGESTNGCSSLTPQNSRQEGRNSQFHRKGLIDDKLNYTNHLQSPRSLFIDSISGIRESLGSKRPSFDASMMNNEGHPLERGSNVLSSPFYTGNITFGGANALGTTAMRQNRRNLAGTSEFQLRVPRRASVQVRPSNVPGVDSSGMSQTAKRILEALEHFSSPIADAKKIPVKAQSFNSTLAKKRGCDEAFDLPPVSRVGLRHLTRELAVPTVPDMLKLKRRQRLQDTTLAARRIITAKSEPLPSQNTIEATEPTEYHMRNDDDGQKFFGKLRAKGKKKLDIEEPPETVNLPSIVLPITSLPSFDIPLPKFTSISSTASTASIDTKLSLSPSKSFKFSSPIKIQSDITSPVKSINHFTFSKPLSPNSKEKSKPEPSKPAANSLSFSFGSNQATPSTNFVWNASSTAPRLKEAKQVEKKKEEEQLKTGSVMDILGGSVKKEETTIWECSECFIKNNQKDDTCAACKNPRKKDAVKKSTTNLLPASATTENNFGSQFKMTTDKWECQCCLVRNPMSESKCLSCMTPKQEKKPEILAQKIQPLETSKSELLDKFKPAKDSWECPGCMLRNLSGVISCPCCNTSKPGLLKTPTPKKEEDTKPLPKEDTSNTWECSTCMVRNKWSDSTCVCCSATNPSAASKTPVISTPSSIPTITSGFGDKFKTPVGSWSCNTCMVNNKPDVTECVACGGLKPGATASKQKTEESSNKTDSVPKFSFGIPASSTGATFSFGISNNSTSEETAKAETTSTNGFTFGIAVTTQTSTGFTFGIPKTTQAESPTSTAKPTGFTFAAPKTIVSEAKKPEVQTLFNNTSDTKVGFSFSNPTESKTEPSKEQMIPLTQKQEPVKAINFGTPTTILSAQKNTQNTPATTSTTSSLFSFGNPSPASTESAPVLRFGQNSTSLGPPVAPSETPKISESAEKSVLSFTKSESTLSIFGAEKSETKRALSLGSSTTKSTEKSIFAVENKLPSFGTIENKASIFANASDKPMFTAPTSAFGVSTIPTTTTTPAIPATPSLFGSSSAGSLISTPTPSFGTPSSSTSTPSLFPTLKPAEQPANSGLFTFGASNSQSNPQPTIGGFNITGPSNPAPKPAFDFGFSNQKTQQPNTSFGFRAERSTMTPAPAPTPTPTPKFSFNAPKPEAPPSFGQTSTATPNIFGNSQPSSTSSFGTVNSVTSGGFNFGAPAAATPTPSTASTASSSGAFNFSTGAPAAGFNFNMTPSFNFTGGNAPATFNATPQATTQGTRRIRKAARRLPPRA